MNKCCSAWKTCECVGETFPGWKSRKSHGNESSRRKRFPGGKRRKSRGNFESSREKTSRELFPDSAAGPVSYTNYNDDEQDNNDKENKHASCVYSDGSSWSETLTSLDQQMKSDQIAKIIYFDLESVSYHGSLGSLAVVLMMRMSLCWLEIMCLYFV